MPYLVASSLVVAGAHTCVRQLFPKHLGMVNMDMLILPKESLVSKHRPVARQGKVKCLQELLEP
jgi:hypothetical protein